jgi:hypothetical protein
LFFGNRVSGEGTQGKELRAIKGGAKVLFFAQDIPKENKFS